jgi:hypothetical protein
MNEIARNPATEVCFRRLLNTADDFGRNSANPTLVRAACYPRMLDDITDTDIREHLSAMERARLITLYQVNGEAYLEIIDFRQQLRLKRSKFPAPTSHLPIQRAADNTQGSSEPQSHARQMHTSVEVESESEIESELRQSARIPDYTSHLPIQRTADDMQVSRELPSSDSFDFEDFFERCYARHPKKGDRILAAQYLQEVLFKSVSPGDFETSHIDHCERDDEWRRGYAPKLSNWVRNQGWKDEPTPPADNKDPGSASAIAADLMEGNR